MIGRVLDIAVACAIGVQLMSRLKRRAARVGRRYDWRRWWRWLGELGLAHDAIARLARGLRGRAEGGGGGDVIARGAGFGGEAALRWHGEEEVTAIEKGDVQ